ncbi:MAG: hypothetical protein V1804_04710 [Patescibacteria group bacterium]
MFCQKLLEKKFFLYILLIFGFTFAPNFSYAFWPADWSLNAVMTTSLDKMYRQIEGAVMGSLKQAAEQTYYQTINNAISMGQGGGPMFISNWEDFLVNQPVRNANLYMNDFFSGVTSGRGNSFNYSGSRLFGSMEGTGNGQNGKVAGASLTREGIVKGDSTLFGIQNNYQSALIQEAKQATTGASIRQCDITDTSDMFTSGNWSKFNTVIGVDTCNKFGLNNLAQNAYSSKIASYQESAKTQGIAYQGYKPLTSGGYVLTPGSTIASIQSQAEDLGTKIIAAANSPAEVITSLVTRLATRTIQSGIGQAQSYVQREINNKMYNATRDIRQATDPRQIFKPRY